MHAFTATPRGGTLDTFFVLKSDGSSLSRTPTPSRKFKKKFATAWRWKDSKRCLDTRQGPSGHSRSPPPWRFLRIRQARTLPSKSPPRTVRACWLDWDQCLSEHHVSVQGAKIQTLGERVEDVFFSRPMPRAVRCSNDASLAKIEQRVSLRYWAHHRATVAHRRSSSI